MNPFLEDNGTRAKESLAQKCASIWKMAESHRIFWKRRGLFHYLKASWRSAALYVHWKRFLKAFRRFRLITLILRVTTLLLSVLETGALVLFSTLLLLLCLPIFIFLLLGVFLTAIWEAPRKSREIHAAIGQNRVYVLFLEEESGAFFKANACDLAARKDSTVVIVSPYLLSPRGILKKAPFYATARKETANVFLVRRYYFFYLRKKVLTNRTCAILC